MKRFPILLLAALLALPSSLLAQGGDEELGETSTRGLATQYRKCEHWALKCVILSSLGTRWHPSAGEFILLSLNDKDRRIRAYAVEALRRADPETLKAAANREIMDSLVNKQILIEEPFYQTRVMELLKAIGGGAGAAGKKEWAAWWSQKRDAWVPGSWTATRKEAPSTNPDGTPLAGHRGTTAELFVERAFDLNQAGLEIGICIDATGSMQPTIDSARDTVKDLTAVLRGIAPKFRMGLVWYRDYDCSKKGAEISQVLTENVDTVQSKLKSLTANGGGDFPERVEKGLELVVSPAMGWQPTTHKVIVLVGDAPPHSENVEKTNELVKKAHEAPAGKPDEKPDVPTGPGAAAPKPKKKGFTVSALAVGRDSIAPATDDTFRKIAEIGGGTYGEILVAAKGAADSSGEMIIEHVLTSSFGEAWRASTRVFVKIYLEYRRNKFFP